MRARGQGVLEGGKRGAEREGNLLRRMLGDPSYSQLPVLVPDPGSHNSQSSSVPTELNRVD